MSAEDARSFLESVAGYTEQPGGEVGSEDRPVKLGTIDALYTTGNPKVLFDGESLMGVRTYPWVGRQPRPLERVMLVPQGHTYVIVGTIGTTPGADLPPGTSIEGYWTTAPAGFVLEDGTVYLRATYPMLFAVIGTAYNTGGETASQFRVPDSRGHAQVGKAASGTFGTLGAKTGVETVTLTAAQSGLPSHQHGVLGGSGAFLSTGSGANNANWVGTGASFQYNNLTAAAGGGAASASHNNVQPSIIVNRAIKV